jgi:hypothetical protein
LSEKIDSRSGLHRTSSRHGGEDYVGGKPDSLDKF